MPAAKAFGNTQTLSPSGFQNIVDAALGQSPTNLATMHVLQHSGVVFSYSPVHLIFVVSCLSDGPQHLRQKFEQPHPRINSLRAGARPLGSARIWGRIRSAVIEVASVNCSSYCTPAETMGGLNSLPGGIPGRTYDDGCCCCVCSTLLSLGD